MTVPRTTRRPLDGWIEPFLIFLAGVLIAWPLRGHFVKPHIDFFDFNDAADALLNSPFESSHKRAPVYPAILAIGGGIVRTLGVVDPPARQVFAEWFNASLLPLNALLVYWLGKRWCAAASSCCDCAPWIAVAFLVMPLGLAMTAHLLVEPLLTTLILTTILAADLKQPVLAYALSALAIMTRYDAAGLLFGIVAADFLVKRRRFALVGAFCSLLPLAVWLALTTVHWRQELDQHYLQQIADRPRFDLLWSFRVILDACFSPTRIPLPAWIDLDESWLRWTCRSALGLLVCVGVWRLAKSRSRSALAALGCAIGYILVHATFPFRWERFGYPLAPLLLLAAGVGAGWTIEYSRTVLNQLQGRFIIKSALAFVAMFLCLIAFIGMSQAILDAYHGGPATWFVSLLARTTPVLAFLLLFSSWKKWWFSVVLGIFIIAWLVPLQLREADPVLGNGREREGLVKAAQWIAANCTPDEIVLTDQIGLMRLYMPDRRDKFLALWQIESDNWSDIIAECRRRGVRKVMWHSAVYEEHAHEAYAGWWRVERFAPLDTPTTPAPIQLVQVFDGEPKVSVFEIAP